MKQSTTNYMKFNLRWVCGLGVLESLGMRRVLAELVIRHTHLTHSFLLQKEDPRQCVACDHQQTVKHILFGWVDFIESRNRRFDVKSVQDPGGGALRYRGGPHLRYVFRGRRGLFLRPPHVRDFVKEGYFFVPRYEVWGSKSPYNPRNIRGSDAEWLPKWLGFQVCCRHLLPLN